MSELLPNYGFDDISPHEDVPHEEKKRNYYLIIKRIMGSVLFTGLIFIFLILILPPMSNFILVIDSKLLLMYRVKIGTMLSSMFEIEQIYFNTGIIDIYNIIFAYRQCFGNFITFVVDITLTFGLLI